MEVGEGMREEGRGEGADGRAGGKRPTVTFAITIALEAVRGNAVGCGFV